MDFPISACLIWRMMADCLEQDDFSSIRHPALSFCLNMIFSENRFPPRNPSAGQAFSGSCSGAQGCLTHLSWDGSGPCVLGIAALWLMNRDRPRPLGMDGE